MNKRSLKRTLKTGRTWFWSRSREALWNKGETSGNTQDVVSVTADCDRDTLLVQVNQTGVACHTGARDCFIEPLQTRPNGDTAAWTVLGSLIGTIQKRRRTMKEGSYTVKLFQGGIDRIGKKVIEEAGESVIAAKNVEFGIETGKDELRYEVADLLYHTLVMLESCEIAPAEILDEIKRRF